MTELMGEIAGAKCVSDLVVIVTENSVHGENLAAFKDKAKELQLTAEEWNEIYIWCELNSEIEAYARKQTLVS